MTKLMTPTMKEERVMMKDELARAAGRVVTVANDLGQKTTVAIVPAVPGMDDEKAGFYYVGVAHCSDTDKYKRKYGEWLALERLLVMGGMPVRANGRCMETVLHDVADAVGGY